MDDVIREFLVESHENLERLDQEFLALEKEPTNTELLSSVFRTIHTIKGTAGFLGFEKLERVAHVTENILSQLRDGKRELDSELVTVLLEAVDSIKQNLAAIENTGEEDDRDYRDLLGKLQEVCDRHVGSEEVTESSAVPPSPDLAASSVPDEQPFTAAAPGQRSEPEHASQAVESVLRVDVGLLDKLMNLVGELVLTRNQILQCVSTQEDLTFTAAVQRLNLITTELQEGVMRTRMQPIGNAWKKLPRVVRDLAHALGKQVRLELEGADTGLDKTIIEAIKDPLTHIVRNSVDHGIEPPDLRAAKGKPREGRILIRAYHEGGQVNIEISDDGAGIALDRVKKKAMEKGLITAERADHMNEKEICHLICLPGFSTAEKVTSVSGRGVGMDVVRTNIEKLGGVFDIQSKTDQGTIIKIKIPLTLAIIPALIVTSGGQRFAIPQVNLLELARFAGREALQNIELIAGAPVYRLRGSLLPLVYLDRILGMQNGQQNIEDTEQVSIVVLQADNRQFGLVVESIRDTEEIVVKPLGKQLKGIPYFAGATIMGDGKVALILDVLGIAHHAGLISERREQEFTEAVEKQDQGASRQTLLLLSASGRERLAVPLAWVDRLEEFPRESIELAAGREVVQYRGQILPLVHLAVCLSLPLLPPQDTLQVIVFRQGQKNLGLVVQQILDIVEEEVKLDREMQRQGILGSAIIQGRVVDLLDLYQVIQDHNPHRFEDKTAGNGEPIAGRTNDNHRDGRRELNSW